MSTAFKRPDGTVVVKCETCGKRRHFLDFLIGEMNPKKKECWDPVCKHCRPQAPYTQDVIDAIGMPKDANWDDKVVDCSCGDGKFRYRNGQVGGTHFRCVGKGYQTWTDIAANYCHDIKEAAGTNLRTALNSMREEREPKPQPQRQVKPQVQRQTSVNIPSNIEMEDDDEDFSSIFGQ